MMRIDVISLFPDMFPGPLAGSITGRAFERGLAELHSHDLRQWGLGRHRSVDDYPYGGGAGMILRPEPIAAALDAVAPSESAAFRILLDPGGERFGQARAEDLAARDHVVLVCPRYEGVDHRVRAMVDLELSIGDFVLSGGEMAALTILDACIRLLPGVMGAASSGEDESFEAGLLEYPHYTRPVDWEGRTIPEVLRSGDHAKIDAWRRERAAADTRSRRPDLIERHGDARRPPPSGARHEEESE